MAKRKLKSIAHHRNGVGGCPFYVAVIQEGRDKMLAVTFNDEPAHVRTAIFDLKLLADGNIKFGENSYRGDHYHQFMLDEIKKHEASFESGDTTNTQTKG